MLINGLSPDVIYYKYKTKQKKENTVHRAKKNVYFSFRYFLLRSTTEKTYVLYYKALTFDINYGHLNL